MYAEGREQWPLCRAKEAREVADAGMTDLQFKAYLRALIEDIEQALQITPENPQLTRLLARLRRDLEG